MLILLLSLHTKQRFWKACFKMQALAYILMSASSSAAARAHIDRGNWVEHGGHKFTEMANVSIAMSFFAFVAFAFTTLISGLILSRFT